MKYVIVEDLNTLTRAVVVFPSTIEHAAMVPAGSRPVSAGFWKILGYFPPSPTPVVLTSGESISLGLSPKEEDRDAIKSLLLDRELEVLYSCAEKRNDPPGNLAPLIEALEWYAGRLRPEDRLADNGERAEKALTHLANPPTSVPSVP